MRGRAYRWLAAIPAVGIIVGVPIANRIHLYVFGLPFLLAWILRLPLSHDSDPLLELATDAAHLPEQPPVH